MCGFCHQIVAREPSGNLSRYFTIDPEGIAPDVRSSSTLLSGAIRKPGSGREICMVYLYSDLKVVYLRDPWRRSHEN